MKTCQYTKVHMYRVCVQRLPTAIINFGGLLECISMVAHRAIGNIIDNIMVVR